jgi:hypothetical protein
MGASIDALVTAGDLELFTSGGSQDVIRTFALLGDPLTPARVQPVRRTYLPVVQR